MWLVGAKMRLTAEEPRFVFISVILDTNLNSHAWLLAALPFSFMPVCQSSLARVEGTGKPCGGFISLNRKHRHSGPCFGEICFWDPLL